MPRTNAPVRVDYSVRLFRATVEDVREWLGRQATRLAVMAAVIFLGAALLAWLVRGGEMEFLVPLLVGAAAVLLAGVGVFAAHLLYLSPRKLCAAKQQQLDAERRQFASALEKERQATQFALAERDVLKTRLEERPLRPLELRAEIDQLIAEGEALLTAEESTLIGESDLWLDDVERFAKRHLSPDQYDRLHAASPPDLAKQVKLHRNPSGKGPVPPEEFAVAEQLVRIKTGLKELRQGIGGQAG
ncbi:MAG: hypothetical protein WDN28_08035 [Chthoniobacter sp.]